MQILFNLWDTFNVTMLANNTVDMNKSKKGILIALFPYLFYLEYGKQYVTQVLNGTEQYLLFVLVLFALYFIYRIGFKQTLPQSLFFVAIAIVLGTIVNTIIPATLISLFKIIKLELPKETTYNIICIFINLSYTTLIFILRPQIKSLYNKFNDIETKFVNSRIVRLVILLFVPFLLLSLVMVSRIIYSDEYIIPVKITLAVIILFFFYLLLEASKKALNEAEQIYNMKAQQQYIDSYSNIVKDVRRFWHNYSNIIETINYITRMEDVSKEELDELLAEVLDWNNKNALGNKIKVTEIKNPVLAGIVSTKIHYAESLGVNLDVEVQDSNTIIPMNMIDYTEVLTILLDNAIEVASKTEEKYVSMKIKAGNEIEISNYMSIIDGIVQKSQSRGIGLKLLEDIISKYNVKYIIDKKENYYTVSFAILN